MDLQELKRQTREAIQHNVSLDVIVKTVWWASRRQLLNDIELEQAKGFEADTILQGLVAKLKVEAVIDKKGLANE